jgi:hypothetical protein
MNTTHNKKVVVLLLSKTYLAAQNLKIFLTMWKKHGLYNHLHYYCGFTRFAGVYETNL